MNKKTLYIIIAVLTIVLVTIGGFYAVGYYQEKMNEQFSDGWIQGQRDYVVEQYQTGIVVYPVIENGTIIDFAETSFNEISGGGQ